MGELGGWVGGAVWGHAHQSPDGPAIHTQLPPVLPAQGDSPLLSHPSSPSRPAHSSSQVVHCRVCPPHPLHAPVLVLHLAVYPASPTQGRVGSLTGYHTVHRHSATRPDEVCLSVKYLVCGNSLLYSETAACDCCMMQALLVCVFTDPLLLFL